ncbi:MAG: MOSC domain-containing protein [Myxococcales bacterium]|nr:MOSC domain-containing protein [Myxococcales bacterium]
MSRALFDNFPRSGEVTWIGLRPSRHAPIDVVTEVQALEQQGLEGDRSASGRRGKKRQVTLIQAEHLAVIAAFAGREDVVPELLRRNIVVSGINLWAMRTTPFTIGDAVLVGTGRCAPCSQMEEALGLGGLNAMRGHGGITAQVVRGGLIRVGDAVVATPEGSAG